MPESVEEQNKKPFRRQFRAPWATLVGQDRFALWPNQTLTSLSPLRGRCFCHALQAKEPIDPPVRLILARQPRA